MSYCKRLCAEAETYSLFQVTGMGGRKKRQLEKTLKSSERILKALGGPSRLPRPLTIPVRSLMSLKGLILAWWVDESLQKAPRGRKTFQNVSDYLIGGEKEKASLKDP